MAAGFLSPLIVFGLPATDQAGFRCALFFLGISSGVAVEPEPGPETPVEVSRPRKGGLIFGNGYDFFEGPRITRKRRKPEREQEPEPEIAKEPPPIVPPVLPEPEPFITAQLLESLAEAPVEKPIVLHGALAEARRPVERFQETIADVQAISPVLAVPSRAAIARANAKAEVERIARQEQLEAEDMEAITAILLALDL